jgi:hypothetical protein
VNEMTRGIETCPSCYKTCLSMAMNHCLETGGSHVEPAHFRLIPRVLACSSRHQVRLCSYRSRTS